jgi:hypothetical protein
VSSGFIIPHRARVPPLFKHSGQSSGNGSNAVCSFRRSSYATKFRLLGKDRNPCPETPAKRQSSSDKRNQQFIAFNNTGEDEERKSPEEVAVSFANTCLPLPLVDDLPLSLLGIILRCSIR